MCPSLNINELPVNITPKYKRITNIDVLQKIFYNYHELKLSFPTMKALLDADLTHSQEAIPDYYHLAPKISQYEHHTTLQIDDIQQVNSRYFFYDYGFIAWEITFRLSTTQYNSKPIIDQLKRYGQKVAIHNKLRLCQQRHEGSLCLSCKTRDVFPIFYVTQVKHYKSFEKLRQDLSIPLKRQKIKVIGKNSECRWIISNKKILIDASKLRKKKPTYTFFATILFSITLVKGLALFGEELLFDHLKMLPMLVTDEQKLAFARDLQKIHVKFSFLYFWAHPYFILNTTETRLRLSTMEFHCLRYAYSNVGSKSIWNDYSRLYAVLSGINFYVTQLLISISMNFPVNTMSAFIRGINPLNQAFPPIEEFVDLFSEIDQRIIIELINHTIAQPEIPANWDINFIRKIAVSQTRIGEMIDRTSGSFIPHLKGSIKNLLKIGILCSISKSELQLTIGRAQIYYYLNPDFPYIRALINYSSYYKEKLQGTS